LTSPELILASKSPRRIELLSSLGLEFQIAPAHLEEDAHMHLAPGDVVMSLARMKAMHVATSYPESLVIGSDTIVVHHGVVLGQPKNRDDAWSMLKKLNDDTHYVYTGLALCQVKPAVCKVDFVKSAVTFRYNTDEEIQAYLDSGEPFDKAGAYAIQGIGRSLIQGYKGCFHNIVGFPLIRFARLFQKVTGKSVFDHIHCKCSHQSDE